VSTAGAGNGAAVTAQAARQLSQTELEMAEGRKAVERRTIQRAVAIPPKKTNVIPLLSGETVETGIVAAATAKQAHAEGIKREMPPVAKELQKQDSMAGQNTLSGNTDASIEFLHDRTATHPLWHPQLSFTRVDWATGEEAKGFETASFARDANGNPDWDKVRRWINNRQGRGNIYWTVNAARVMNKKPAKKDIVAIVSLHTDLDPRPGEDQDAAEERLIKDIEGYRHGASIIVKSGGGVWGIYDLIEPIQIDGDPEKIKDAESYNVALAHDLGGDNCHNIDRVARLPGTANIPNAGKLAKGRRAKLATVHRRSEARHAIESFTKAVVDAMTEASRAPLVGQEATATADKTQKYEPVAREAPDLAKFPPIWLARIFDGDIDGKYKGDRSRLALSIACELVRAELGDDFIARVLMTTKCGAHVQESPARRLARTIGRAHEFVTDPDLEEMNSKHAVLPIGDKTRVVTWGPDDEFPGRITIARAQSLHDFASLHNNKRKTIIIPEVDGDGNEAGKFRSKRIPLGSWWLNQTRRRQYDGGRKFMPQHDADVVGNVLNMFEGFPIQARKPDGCSGASGCQLFLAHGLKIMCSGNEEHWKYLLKREAWIAQHRQRSEIAAAYRTEAEGSGKGFWCNHLGHLYGPHFMQVSNPEHVIGKHNPHLETLIKLCADEALFVGDPRHRNALFSLITEPRLTVEPKFINTYSAPNYLNIDITTNAKHFVPASRTARRFFIPTVSENRVGDREYFHAIEAQLKDGGYEALLYHLQYEVDLRDFDVRRVPKTAGLAEQVEYSRKGLDGLVEQVCSEGCVPCAHHLWSGFSISNGYEMKQGFDYFIDTHHDRELRDLRSLKVKRRLLKEWNCLSGDNAKRREGFGWTYGIKWPPLDELRALFVERHGPQDWLHPGVTEWPVSDRITSAAVGQAA
jgi:hypothetical protein